MKRLALFLIVCIGLLAGPAFAQDGMRMPDEVYRTLQAVVQKYPHTGTDDERRAAMEKVVQTIRARHGLRYVWKTEHASLIAPSKDGLGYVADGEVTHGKLTVMFIWDTISGTTREPYGPPLISEAARPAYVLAVEPKDWLAGTPAQPPNPLPTPPPPPPPANLAEMLQRVLDQMAMLETRINALDSANRVIQADVLELKNRKAPDYTGAVLGFGVTLRPKP